MISKFFTKSILSSLFLSVALGVTACGQNNPNDNEDVECGNGTLEEGEQCDDGDARDGDGCSSACEIEEGPSEAEQINEYIKSLDLVPAEILPEVINSETPAAVTADGNYSCSTVNLTKTVPLTSISIITDPTGALFPGDILLGDSLYNGTFASSGIDRKPMTYSLSIQDGTDVPRSATMQNPSLSAFRDSVGGILAQANLDSVPVKAAQATITEITTEEELNIALAADVNTAQVDVAAQFTFGAQQKQSQFLVTIDVAFFTADIDTNLKPSDFFADSVTADEVKQEFNDQNPPVYVSSTTYGTRYYLGISSDFSSEELSAALQASFNGAATDVDGSISLDTKEIMQNTTINFVTVGATPEQIENFGAVIGADDPFDAIKKFMGNAENFSAANIGAPLTFTMRHLSDNSITALAFSGTSDVQTCERISQNIRTTLKSVSVSGANDTGGAGAIELFGVVFATGLERKNLLNFGESQFFQIDDGEPFLGNGAQFQQVIHIDPRDPAAKIQLVADFIEADNVNSDNIAFTSLDVNRDSEGSVGNEQLLGQGFSGQYSIFIPSSEGNITVTFELKPIQ
jgi:cysteine-rich repeat protein